MADLATHRTAPGPALLAPHRRHAVDQRQELRDVVAGRRTAPAAGAVCVGRHVVLRARTCTVNRTRAGL